MAEEKSSAEERRSKLRNLAAETRMMIREDAQRRAAELAEAVHSGPVEDPVSVADAIRRIQET